MISELRSPELSKALRINPGTVGYCAPTHFYTHSTCKFLLMNTELLQARKATQYWLKHEEKCEVDRKWHETTHKNIRATWKKTLTAALSLTGLQASRISPYVNAKRWMTCEHWETCWRGSPAGNGDFYLCRRYGGVEWVEIPDCRHDWDFFFFFFF